jgi:DNA segregation ATPase FtsK/SpoIIIE, S-DNA-T family
MASARKKKRAPRTPRMHPGREASGIVLIALALFVGCCLFSYHPEDPSFTIQYSERPDTIHNLGGLIGSHCAGFLFEVLLGLGAFIVPVAMLWLAFKLLFKPCFDRWFWFRSALCLVLFVVIEVFFSLTFGVLALERFRFNAGGEIVGGLPARLLDSSIGLIGAYLLIVLLALITIMILTRVSFVVLSGRIVDGLRLRVLQPAADLTARVRDWRAERAAAARRDRPVSVRSIPQPLFPADEITPPVSEPQEAGAPDDIPIHVYLEKDHLDAVPDPHESDDFTPRRAASYASYELPPLSLLDTADDAGIEFDRERLRDDAEVLLQKLADFGVGGRVVEIGPGPVITRFEFEPASGVKLNKIVNLADDLALALKAVSVRIAPIPGKSVVGIELPSKKRKTVSFREIVARDEFVQSRSLLTLGLGKDIGGGTVINDLARMPHLLVAGTTGSGKSVFVNTVICSILFKATPDQVRFLMIDPKRLELFPYDGIPHLLHPVVVNPKKAAVALQWAVEEMERRYRVLAEKGTRDIVQYNKKIEHERQNWKGGITEEPPALMPYIVVVIDELADLMMIAARDVEQFIARLAQMARASGIHLLIATQRPSVDILTGVIKANFPSRISFKVSSKVDSRTILDMMGAEKLLGMGDMLFIPPGTSRLLRIHGAFISEQEITRVTEFIKKQAQPAYDETILAVRDEESAIEQEDDYDELYDKAVALVTETRQASISNLQRRMRIGYNRAARMIERMEREGVVGPSDGVKPRDVLVNKL